MFEKVFRAFAIIACLFAGSAAAEEPAGAIRIDGSSTVYPVTRAAASAFTKDSGIPVSVDFSGTGGGFRKFVRGETEIQDASRPILTAEIEAAKAAGIEFIELPLAYDALTIAVHPKNTWANDITVSELKKLWERSAQGRITKWSDVRKGWPDETIALFGPGMDSGTKDYFSEVIVGDTDGLRSDYLGSEDDEVIAQGIASNPHALGFLPFAYFVEHEKELKALAVAWDFDPRTGNNPGGKPVLPTSRNLVSGAYVPLGRPLFLYVNRAALDKNPAVGSFLEYMLGAGRSHIRDAGYVTLNEQAYVDTLGHLHDRSTGTRFGGQIPSGIAIHDIITLDPQ